MHVIATAGHVDHGKSTLIRQLTGMEPDRWAEERRRGMTIDLGFAWTTMVDGDTVAFVDVPGHERFVPTMLAGVGPAPAVMFVVAADEGWMPQSAEHLDALAALGVRHGVLVITRSDLADPGPATAQARHHLDGTSLSGLPAVHVSGRTGAGVGELRQELHLLAHRLPQPELDADLRLWVDRAFSIRGSGPVVTGTLQAGQLAVGDELRLHSPGARVSVRGLHCLGEATDRADSVARVAVNLRGVEIAHLGRGDALLSPQAWLTTETLDVRLHGADATRLPRELMLHIGSASTSARIRPLGSASARLSLRTGLPLRIGDRALLRDPGSRTIVAGISVLDVRPPALTRRGEARQRAADLDTRGEQPDGAGELRRRRLVRADELRAMGAAPPPHARQAAGWLLDERLRQELGTRLRHVVVRHQEEDPLAAGMPVEAARRALGLPDQGLLRPVLDTPAASDLSLDAGKLRCGPSTFPEPVRRALAKVKAHLEASPFDAPVADQLAEFGLGERELAAAANAGELLRLGAGLVLLPDAHHRAVEMLTALPSPFTVSEVRRHLGTTRRVAVPLLEFLAREGLTARMPDGRHRLRSPT